MTRSRDVSSTQANLGGAVAPFVAGKNKLINGDFSQWQRGTSFNLSANNVIYTADRWYGFTSGTVTASVSQQTFTPGAAPVAGYEGKTFWRWTTTSQTSGGNNRWGQRIEDVRTLAGQTVTLSFWAKADATRVIQPVFYQETDGTGSNFTYGTNITLSTSWTRYTQTFSLPSMSGKTIGANSMLIAFFDLPINTAMSIDFWGLQLEAGSVATPFTPAGGGFPGAELALCQRYYYRQGGAGTYQTVGIGWANAGGLIQCKTIFPVTMRITPSSVDYSTLIFLDQSNAGIATGTLSIVSTQSSNQIGYLTSVTSTGTQYRNYDLTTNNSTSGYLGFSAEL